MNDKYLKILSEVSDSTYTDLELNLINSMIKLRLSFDSLIQTDIEDYFLETVLEISEQAYKVYLRLKKDE